MPVLCQICRHCGCKTLCRRRNEFDKIPIHTIWQRKRYQGKHGPNCWSSWAVTAHITVYNLQDGVQCQHGPHECELNRILSCAIHLNPDQFVWFPFAKCLESRALGKHHPLEPAEPCAAETGIDYTAVQDCASGTEPGCGCCEGPCLWQNITRGLHAATRHMP